MKKWQEKFYLGVVIASLMIISWSSSKLLVWSEDGQTTVSSAEIIGKKEDSSSQSTVKTDERINEDSQENTLNQNPKIHPIDTTIQNINQENGTYDVLVKINDSIPSGIREVQVPIWSTSNQSDIKWYIAQKQNDDTYLVHMNFNNHQYHRAIYHTHLYIRSNDGKHDKGMVLEDTLIETRNTQLEGLIQNVDVKSGTYDVVIKGQMSAGIQKILVPIWSDKNQSDIKWYEATRQADGTYRVHMSIANHQYHRGTYQTHVYMYSNDGSQRGVVLDNTQMPDVNTVLNAEIQNVDRKRGTYDVVIHGYMDSGIRQILVPIWSANNQSDIKWYEATRQDDGSYLVHMNIAHHQFNIATYNTHIYMYGNNGQQRGMVLPQIAVDATELGESIGGKIVNIEQSKGTFDVYVYTSSKVGSKKVRVPIWSTANQSDIKWYEAKRINDYTYKISFTVKNHNYAAGTYYIHAYSTNASGQTVATDLGKVKLSGNYETLKLNYLRTNRTKIINELNQHKALYFSTPYLGLRTNNAELYMRPGIAMNCTGFVATVIRNSGGDLSKISSIANKFGGVANAYNWRDALTKKVRYCTFNSVAELLNSKKAVKGDLLYFEPNYSVPNYDCHIGFYWGDYPGHNQFWHELDGNKISHIYAAAPYTKIYLFSMGVE